MARKVSVRPKQGPGPRGGYSVSGNRTFRVSRETRQGVDEIVKRLEPQYGRLPTLIEAVGTAVATYRRDCVRGRISKRSFADALAALKGWDGPQGGISDRGDVHVSLETHSDLLAIKGILLTRFGWDGSFGEIIGLAVEHYRNGGKG